MYNCEVYQDNKKNRIMTIWRLTFGELKQIRLLFITAKPLLFITAKP